MCSLKPLALSLLAVIGVSTQSVTAPQAKKTFLADVIGPVNLKALLGTLDDRDHSHRLEAQCFEMDDGEIICALDNYPGDGFVTLFGTCPRLPEFPLIDCGSCEIVLTESVWTIENSDPACTSCTICSDWIAWDCRNIVPDGDCSLTTCPAAECVLAAPTPPPTSPPLTCPSLPGTYTSDSTCSDCLDSCQGDPLCCIGNGCYCESECSVSSRVLSCSNYVADYVPRYDIDCSNPYLPCATISEGCCPAECGDIHSDVCIDCDSLTSCPSTEEIEPTAPPTGNRDDSGTAPPTGNRDDSGSKSALTTTRNLILLCLGFSLAGFTTAVY